MNAMRNVGSDPDGLDPARLSAAAIYAVMFSAATGTLAQIAVFRLIAPVTEVVVTNPPDPPQDRSYPTDFPSYDLLSLLIACFVLIRYSPGLSKRLARAGFPGLTGMLAVSMTVFALSALLIYAPVWPFLSVMPNLVVGLLLNALHYAVTYGPMFAVAFLSAAHLGIRGQKTTPRIVPMLAPALVSAVLVVLWQFWYWPLWDSHNF
jgi:hypothetical protein